MAAATQRRSLIVLATLVALVQAGCSPVGLAPPDPTADNLRLTVSNAPLPPEAFKARIAFAYEAPLQMRAGVTTAIHLLITNLSSVQWPSAGRSDGKYQLRIGNRWLDSSGRAFDDSRVSFSHDVHPAETAEILIAVNPPNMPGEYTLEFDLVQEDVRWFREAGSESLRVKVNVEP